MRSIVLILLFSPLLMISCNGKKNKENNDRQLPLYIDLDGRTMRLEQYKGKRILVNYWAVWCVPCLKEFPSLVTAQETLKQEDYVFLFPSPDPIDEIVNFNKKKNYPLKFLSITKPLDKLNIYALPSTTIYSRDGSVYRKVEGATDWSSPEIIEMLRSVP